MEICLDLDAYLGVEAYMGMLDRAFMLDFLTKVMLNVALMAGSSKHGKVFLASVACSWVVASHLKSVFNFCLT